MTALYQRYQRAFLLITTRKQMRIAVTGISLWFILVGELSANIALLNSQSILIDGPQGQKTIPLPDVIMPCACTPAASVIEFDPSTDDLFVLSIGGLFRLDPLTEQIVNTGAIGEFEGWDHITAIPEPTALTLAAALGLIGCAVRWRRGRR